MDDNNIKEIRKLRKMTQVELAQKLGVTQGAVQKLETGINDLTSKMMQKLAKALDCEPWELLPKEMQPNITPEEMEVLRAVRKTKQSVAKTDDISETKAG